MCLHRETRVEVPQRPSSSSDGMNADSGTLFIPAELNDVSVRKGKAMSVGQDYRHDPESCVCPNCGKVLRLFRAPALKALFTNEFYFSCNDCERTSIQIMGISDELICDIHQDSDFRPGAADLFDWCDREIAGLARAAGSRP